MKREVWQFSRTFVLLISSFALALENIGFLLSDLENLKCFLLSFKLASSHAIVTYAEAFPGLSQTSQMKSYTAIVNG